MGERVCVVMPTYNERDNLEATLTSLFENNAGVDVLIVDDDSPDGTGTLAEVISRVTRMPPGMTVAKTHNDMASDTAFVTDDEGADLSNDSTISTADLKVANRVNRATTGSRLFVIHRASKMGLGSAYVRGFQWALKQGYDIVCEMDMDGSHRAEDLHRMLNRIESDPNVDLVLGSRRVPGGTTQDWPWYRDVISRAGSSYARFMLGLKVRDMTCGFRAYRSRILRQVDLAGIDDNGYVFQIDMTRRVIAAGGTVVEVPIVFPERAQGESKMDGAIVREAMQKVTQWGLARMHR
ncbi:MAG: polyprenol monophosphomannose synthase [Bifidobacterium sp.]|nr:polyprenol monophosphomannose synthase [Bifidobacterium sp.]